MKRPTHEIEILLKPIMPLLESRMNEIMMIAYEAGYEDGKASWKLTGPAPEKDTGIDKIWLEAGKGNNEK